MENKTNKSELKINVGPFYRTLYKQSGLPMQYMEEEPHLSPEAVDRECFACLAKVHANCLHVFGKGGGINLLIYSNKVGNGKTSWAIKIMRYYIMRNSVDRPTDTYTFINVPKFMQLRKDAISNPSARKEFEALEYKVKNDRLVVFDDIAYRQGSGFDEEYLYTLIDHRYTNMMNSIFTSNATQLEMREVLGNRIADRILDRRTWKYAIQGGSRRGTQTHYASAPVQLPQSGENVF